MAGQKFEYDESGGTFYYFVLSVFALLLIPSTFYWWPRKQKNDYVIQSSTCSCPGCKKKDALLQKRKPWKTFSSLAIKLLIISGWCFLIFLTYKVSQFDYEYINFDPYEILQIPLGSSEKTVKKAYRKLSLILHPDKETGDEKAFMKLTKAYQALTDDEARKNWERYGNPDGPGAMSFGIALPSWIVEKENSFWVLGLYAAVFMIALPTIVGMWWYKSIKYSNDKVLLETSRMYYHFFHKTPAMPMKRAIMILTASLEFDRKYNSELCDRETDAIEMPKLISQLHNLNEKLREIPFCYKYSVKARALVHAHLSRIPLNAKTLDIDRMAIVKKCPHLIQEMINCISHLILLAYAQRVPRLMNIETLENCMKLCAMIVQGLWEYKSPLLQLPHIQEDHLKHFVTRKRMIRNVQQFAKVKNEDKRQILKFLKDEQYEDVIKAISNMPYIEFDVRCEVIDDEATTVYTAGAIVTVTVTLKRSNLSELFNDEPSVVDATGEVEYNNQREFQDENEKSEKPNNVEEEQSSDKLQQNKGNSKVNWQKRSYKPSSKKSKKQSSQQMKKQQLKTKKKQNWERKQKAKQEQVKQENENDGGSEGINEDKPPVLSNDGEVSDEQLSSDENAESDMEEEETNSNNDGQVRDDDDDDWDKFQSDIKKKDWLAGRKKQSHSVHCPYFPEEKQEYWWVYVSDRKSKTLLTSPYHITELVDYDEIQLKFTAPNWPGVYTFAVCLRSDSYLGFDQMRDIKLDVKEAPQVPTEHPQWDISDEEDEDNQVDNGGDLSEYTTDEDVEEE